jgi:hypothetical protein
LLADQPAIQGRAGRQLGWAEQEGRQCTAGRQAVSAKKAARPEQAGIQGR